jgi:hypothetical protein
MCDPVTIGAIVTGAGKGVDLYSNYESMAAEKKVTDYQASLARVRASLSEQQSFVTQDQADKGFAQQMGRARTAEAAGGVVVDGAGSAQDYALSAASEHAVEKAMIKQQAQQEIWGFQTQADMLRYEGRMKKRAWMMNASGSLLSGIGQGVGAFGGTGGKGGFQGGTFSSLPAGSSYA